ncbi:glycerol kinase GlpK [Facklamia sp. DSM 111018]|uniref:Glycerol kinase n=1 Tax=Facklamia lactis TaxID=2749967 RepID=A0ABS0LNS9_9LACT|nr:glycerol kinase GlpK [Facklamia lactis]MBG9985704.1 glycerol kinase GlpK [Facklamia lactis]
MQQEEFIMAIDQGTTSSRAVLIDRKGKVRASSQKEFRQIFPHSGWVEQDAHEIWLSVQSVMASAFIEGGIQPKQVKGIGITNQRETTVIWDRKTGQPIAHAIVWQSRQSNDICEILKAQGHEQMIQAKTGLPIDPYFSASKIRWLLDHIPGAQERAERGELAFGTIDSWLIWKLSGGELHLTDYSNASRTMLYNIVDLEWDREILELLNIPASLLPQVVSNSEIYGYTTDEHFFGHCIPIAGIAGDQQAALIGQLAFNKGQVKSTYGTGAFILMNLGQDCQLSEQGLTTSIAYKLPNQPVTYCLEGSIFVAGSAVQWLRDGLGMLSDSAESEVLARQSGDHNEVYLVPAFTGLGAPYWDPDARGAVFGLTRATNRADFAKATLQSIAYQVRDIIEWMEAETGVPISSLKVDGGAAQNEYLMQFQADIIGRKVSRQANLETTALGVAYLAGLAVGYWENVEEIQILIEETEDFQPQMNQGQKEQLYQGWKRAVRATRVFSQDID